MSGDISFNSCSYILRKETLFKREVTFDNFSARKTLSKQKLKTCLGPSNCFHEIGEEQIYSEQPFYDLRICSILEKETRRYGDYFFIKICLKNNSSKLTKPIKYSLGVCETNMNINAKSINWDQTNEYLPPDRDSKFICIDDYALIIPYNDTLTVAADITIYEDKNEPNSPDLSGMLYETHLTDVTLKCGDYERKCHRLVLAFKSDVFKAMFAGDRLKNEDPIKIEDTEPIILDAFIDCLYKIKDSFVEKHAFKLLQLADRYNVDDLFVKCSEMLQQSLTKEIVVQCLVLAYLRNDISLEAKCVEIIRTNFQSVKKSQEWKWLTEHHPKILNRIIEKTFI